MYSYLFSGSYYFPPINRLLDKCLVLLLLKLCNSLLVSYDADSFMYSSTVGNEQNFFKNFILYSISKIMHSKIDVLAVS